MTVNVFFDQLPSGLKIATVETPHLHSALCAVHVRVGSRHETNETNGISHLLEHLFFRGSAQYPDSVKMNAAVEAVGGNLNGVTMRDASSFYTPAHPDGVSVSLRILGDMLTQPKLTHIETERSIILEEMLDEVDEQGRDIDVDNLTKRALYGDHPLALKIAGTPQSVRRLTRAMAKRHFEQYYVSGNMVVSVAGPVRRKEVLDVARKAFRGIPVGPRAAETPPPDAPRQRLMFVAHHEAQVEFRLSFPTVSDTHRDAMPLLLLRRVLDDGLSSRLPYRIVEKRGLAYSIQATTESLHDSGTFDVDGACAPRHLAPVLEESLKTLASIRRGVVSDEELERAKKRFAMHIGFLRDSPGDLGGWFGGLALFREPETLEAKSREAQAVTREDVIRAARTYLTEKNMVAVAVGPAKAKPALERVLRQAKRLLGG